MYVLIILYLLVRQGGDNVLSGLYYYKECSTPGATLTLRLNCDSDRTYSQRIHVLILSTVEDFSFKNYGFIPDLMS